MWVASSNNLPTTTTTTRPRSTKQPIAQLHRTMASEVTLRRARLIRFGRHPQATSRNHRVTNGVMPSEQQTVDVHCMSRWKRWLKRAVVSISLKRTSKRQLPPCSKKTKKNRAAIWQRLLIAREAAKELLVLSRMLLRVPKSRGQAFREPMWIPTCQRQLKR